MKIKLNSRNIYLIVFLKKLQRKKKTRKSRIAARKLKI